MLLTVFCYLHLDAQVDHLKSQIESVIKNKDATVVAHKTGSSGTNEKNITAATNDIGIIILPDGSPIFITVLVANSSENEATNEKIISDIAKMVWDYYAKSIL